MDLTIANNYTEFSVVLYPDTWISLEALHSAAPTEKEMDDKDWYFDISVEKDGLWLYGDDVDGALSFIQNLMQKHNAPLTAGIYVSWAETCSKPRPNEFSGGGSVVSANNIFTVYSSNVINKAHNAGIISIK